MTKNIQLIQNKEIKGNCDNHKEDQLRQITRWEIYSKPYQ